MSTAAAQDTPSAMPAEGVPAEEASNASTPRKSPAQRYSSADTYLFASSYVNGSPSQAKKALEDHIADTDQRIQDASQLGTSLVEQRRHLSARLRDVEQEQGNQEIGPELKQKLVDLEREYNEVGKETARTFAANAKGRKPSTDISDPAMSTTFSADGRVSPSKLQAPPRKLKNATSSRVHDIEFATEISTSLLGQVRHLQNILAEREEALRKANEDNAKLQTDADHYGQRLKSLDDNEQKFKDENWHLETQVQDLAAQLKESASREQHLTHNLNTAKGEKVTADKEYADLRETHTKLSDDHSTLQKQHDTEVTALKRNQNANDAEKETLQLKIEELASQNEELAKAVAHLSKTEATSKDVGEVSDDTFESAEQDTPENSPPPSPTKGTPKHSMLEHETVKTSLQHALRNIQNLKNTVHREKTEKIELRRMLQDARDELEMRRSDGGASAANAAKKKKSNGDGFKKPARPDRLGHAKGTQEEIIADPSWEDYDGSPTRSRTANIPGAFQVTDSSDAFETANEKDSIETEGFHTGIESMAGESSDELTETEQTQKTKTRPSFQGLGGKQAGTRMSFQSTASDDYDFNMATPPSFGSQKNKFRGASGSFRALSETPTAKDSPASFVSNSSLPENVTNLAAELQDVGDGGSVATSTPSRSVVSSLHSTPETTRTREISQSSNATTKPQMVDAGMITDPWEPQAPAAVRPTSSPWSLHTRDTSSGSVQKDFATSIGSGSFLADADPDDDLPRSAPFRPRSRQSNTSLRSPPTSPPRSPPAFYQMDSLPAPPAAPIALNLEISAITSQQTEPTEPQVESPRSPRPTPNIPPKSAARRSLSISSGDGGPPTRLFGDSDVGAQPLQNLGTAVQSRDVVPSELDNENTSGVFRSSGSPLTESREPFKQVSGNARSASENNDAVVQKVTQVIESKDEGTQTMVSAQEIEKLIKERSANAIVAPVSPPPGPANYSKPFLPRTSSQDLVTGEPVVDSPTPKSIKRPASAGSATGTRAISSPPPSDPPPPLPFDHRQTIAAASASKNSWSSGAASSSKAPAYRPRTPNETAQLQTPVKASGSTRNRASSWVHTPETRRSSISSFASEIDERFNPGHYPLPDDFDTSDVDPRMIQAITQTMIGEYLWKYTRKAGRGEHSDNRHRRFFWIHPYTRTLYWSDQDPSRAGRQELKAKSVAIEAVRVVTDENPMPPGLHQKSIIVVTPGRSIKFTALTSTRHETWFNALSYLLLRSGSERTEDTTAQAEQFGGFSGTHAERSASYSNLTAEDIAEFNPSSTSTPRTTASSRRSVGSANPQRMSAANRASSTQGRVAVPSLVVRQGQASQQRRAASSTEQLASTPTDTPFKKPGLPASAATPTSTSSRRSRLSFSSRLRPSSVFSLKNRHSSASATQQQSPDVDDASLVSGKSRELVVDETGGIPVEGASTTNLSIHGHHHHHHHGDGLENVRACCDGKHDVGSLSHRSSRPGSSSGK